MKVSRRWLQTYFDNPLPGVQELADALTFHAFEIEEIEDDMLDVKVLPDRASYALSHRGIAKELSAILNIPLKRDPLRESIPKWPETKELVVVADPAYTVRHTGALYKGVKVGPSPDWLKSALESVGQRSINNIVDAMNFVMLDIGQPSGAFDTGTMKKEGGAVKADIRRAKKGEEITVLTGEKYTLTDSMFAFTDAYSGELLDIAGIKGGLSSGVTEKTVDLFISAGNYDPTLLRRASQSLKLFTDASSRFQNRPSPELTAYGMRDILALVEKVAGGELVGVVDIYNAKPEERAVEVTAGDISRLLGREYSGEEVESVFNRLGLSFKKKEKMFTVTSPFERNDIRIPEDLAEEVGRVIGYDKVEPKIFSDSETATEQRRFRGIERVKDFLVERGFMEISTQSFAKKGEIELANPLDDANPFLRAGLAANMAGAMKQAKNYAPLVLPPKTPLRLFELGNIFTKEGERLTLAVSEKVEGLDDELGIKPNTAGGVFEYDLSKVDLEKKGDGHDPKRYAVSPFKPFSIYPFVLRDIAIAVPQAVTEGEVTDFIKKLVPLSADISLQQTTQFVPPSYSELMVSGVSSTVGVFDHYQMPDGRNSYAYRITFKSMDRTLTDDEVNGYMKSITDSLNLKEGWKVR
jgi:phenylalanyl-tRNA synthetase beta chain